MKIMAVIAFTLVFIGLLQAQLAAQPSPVEKAMLLKLIAPDKSEHLIAGMAHRLGLRLEQLPEVVGAIKQSNVLIGELSPCWGNPQQSTCRKTATFKSMQTALSATIGQLKDIDNPTKKTGLLLHKLQAIGRNIDKLKKSNYQRHSLGVESAMADNTPMHSMQVIKEGTAKIDIGGTEVHFNPNDDLESVVVQLLAGGLDNLVKVSLTGQDVGEPSESQPDPEIAYPGQSRQPLVEQLGQERLDKLRHMLQQYDHNPIANILNLTLEHQQAAHVNFTLNSIAIREVSSKAYGGQLDPDAPTIDAQIAATALGAARKHVALEELEELQQHIDQYYSEASEHFRTLDSFIGTTAKLTEFIDHHSISQRAKYYKNFFDVYFKGNVARASSLPYTSEFNRYYVDIVLDQRNLRWMETGKIQKHCTKNNQCLVYVGFSHLLRGKEPLIKLLQKEGFEVRELTAEEREGLLATASSADNGQKHEAHEHGDKQDNELARMRLQEMLQPGEFKKLTQQQINDILIEAASLGELEAAKQAIDKGVDEHILHQALLEVVSHKRIKMKEMVTLLVDEIRKGNPDNYYDVINRAMAIATLQKNKPIAMLLASKGADDFNQALLSAAYGGSKPSVEYTLDLGADDIEGALANAVFRGHTELVEFLIPKLKAKMSPEDFRLALNNLLPLSANIIGMKMLDLLTDAGADDFNNLLLHAANAGDMEKIEFAVEKGADNFAEAFLQALYVKHIGITKYLFDLLQQRQSGAVSDVGPKAFAHAITTDNTELAKFLVRENAVNIDTATRLTTAAKHEAMLEYLVQKGINDPTWTTSARVLEYAAAYGWMKTVAIILEALNHNPHEILLQATVHEKKEMVEFIVNTIGVSIDSLKAAHDLVLIYENDDIRQLLSDKLAEGKLLTASTRLKKFFDANIALAVDTDDAPLNKVLAQKIVHNSMFENNEAFTHLDSAVKATGGWQALAVVMQDTENTKYPRLRFRDRLVQAVVEGKDEQLLSEVVLLYRLISAVQKLEGGKSQYQARKFGLGKSATDTSYTYASHLKGERYFNFPKMQARLNALLKQYVDNKELRHALAALEAWLQKQHE